MCFRPAGAEAGIKKCPACGEENDYFATECKHCGASMPAGAGSLPAIPGVPGAPAAPGAPGVPGVPGAPAAPKAPGK